MLIGLFLLRQKSDRVLDIWRIRTFSLLKGYGSHMGTMRFLKENKNILFMLFMVLILPVFFFGLDEKVVLWIKAFYAVNGNIYSLFHSIDPFVNFIGHGATLIILAFLIWLVGRFLDQRAYETGRALFISLVTSALVVQVMKHLVGRARPKLTEKFLVVGPSLKSGYDSFPSGHTTLAFTLASVLSHHLPRYRILFYTFAIVVCFERVEDGAHFPSDVLAGALLGLIIGNLLSFKSREQSVQDNSKVQQ
jgi:undecaprenyl-diphosphatase